MTDFLPYIFSAFIGIGLAAATGFRVFLPLFLVSLASHFQWIPTNDNLLWLSTLPALITTGVATLVEILGYYIPYIDNFLDSITIPLATVAGAVLFASQFADVDSMSQWALALIAGGGTAGTIAAGFAGTRATSTVTTGGFGNNVVATTETAGAGLMTITALFLPILAFIFAVGLLIIVIVFGRRMWKKIRKKPVKSDKK